MIPHTHIEEYRKNFYLKLKKEEETNKKAKDRALKDVEKIKKYLENEVGVREIYLFGSIIRDDFKMLSDIDIAISGIKNKKFFSIWSQLDEFTEFSIELVDLDEKDDFFRKQIRERGKKIL